MCLFFVPISLISVGSGYLFPSSMDSGTICASPLLHPCHFFSSDQLISHNLFSAPNLIPRQAFASHYGAHLSILHYLFLRNITWIGSIQTLSFSFSHSCLAAHFFQYAILACLRCILFTSCGQTSFMSSATCPSKIKVFQCGHMMPKSRVSHRTAPAGPLTCLRA